MRHAGRFLGQDGGEIGVRVPPVGGGTAGAARLTIGGGAVEPSGETAGRLTVEVVPPRRHPLAHHPPVQQLQCSFPSELSVYRVPPPGCRLRPAAPAASHDQNLRPVRRHHQPQHFVLVVQVSGPPPPNRPRPRHPRRPRSAPRAIPPPPRPQPPARHAPRGGDRRSRDL